MTRHYSVNYNEAYLLVLDNGCLAIGLGDEDLDGSWLDTISLLAPDISIGENLEFNYRKDSRYWHCRNIRAEGRFTGYLTPVAMASNSDYELVPAPVTLEQGNRGLRSTNFQDQLVWIHEQNIRGWSFYPEQNLVDGMVKINWAFTKASDAMMFKLTWC